MAKPSPVFITEPPTNQAAGDLSDANPVSDFNLAVVNAEKDADIYIPPLYGIDQYVVRHSAAVSLNQTLPYARIVGYLSEK
jgi:hypothetical protein